MCRDLESFINASKSRWQPVPHGAKYYCKLCNGPLVPKTVDALGPNTGRDAIACHPHDENGVEIHPLYYMFVNEAREDAPPTSARWPTPRARPLRPCMISDCTVRRTAWKCTRQRCPRHCEIAGGCAVHKALSLTARIQLGQVPTMPSSSSSVSYLEPRTHEEERIQLAAAIAASQSDTALDGDTSSPSIKRRRLLTPSSPSSVSGSPYAIVPQTREEEEEHLATALEASQASFRFRSLHSESSAGGPSTSSVSSLGFTNSSASDSSGFSRSSTSLPSSLSPGLAEAPYVWNPAVLNYVRSAHGSSRSGSVASSNQDGGQDGQDVKGKGKAVVKTEYSECISDSDIIDLTVGED